MRIRFLMLVSAVALLSGCSSAMFKPDGLLAQVANASGAVNTKVTPEEEVKMGRDSAAILLGAAPLLNDAALQNYVNKVGYWVAQQSSQPNLSWRFGVLDDDDVNAFAAPSGYVLITKGLLAILRNESELAGVLAHEVGHIQQQHHLRQVVQQRISQAFVGESANVSIQLGLKGDSEAIQFKTTDLYSNGLARNDELEADRVGVVLAARAGYDPFGLPTALQTMDALKSDDPALALLFKTHPKPSERLAELETSMTALETYAGQAIGEERFRRIAGKYARTAGPK